MALVRVYCGLASTPPAATQNSADALLTVAVVDDAGRLLDVCEVRDDPSGYAELGALLAERSGGTAGLAVAADSDEHQVTLLLAAAGRPLAISDEESLDDYANRFGDDDSTDELEAPVSERRAVGLARALQAGALVAGTLSAPRELIALKPVLSAHAALASGRQGAAVALREVLRELYPAALRAYPDPAEAVPLAVLDALPEPGLLGAGNRGRDAAVAAELTRSGLADEASINDAITALRVAIAETPRRAGIGKTLTTAVAETIRQSVAAVRACDTGIAALVGLLTEKATPITSGLPAPRSRPAAPSAPLRAVREASSELPRVPRRGRTQQPAPVSVDPVTVDPLRVGSGARPAVTRTAIPRREDFAAPAAHAAPPSPSHTAASPAPQPRGGQPRTPSPMAPPPSTPSPMTPPPMAPAASHGMPSAASHAVPEQVNPPAGRPTSAAPVPMSGPPSYSTPPVASAPPSRGAPAPGDPYPSGAYGYPQSRQAPAPENATIPVPAPRPAPEVGPPGSRSDWPLNTSGTGMPAVASDRPGPARLAPHDGPGQPPLGQPTPNPLDPTSFPSTALPPTVLERRGGEPTPERRPVIPRQRDGRVTPPWQDSDLPAEPPALRLVEPAPLADRALRDDRTGMRERDRDREILGSGERTAGDRTAGSATGEFSAQGRAGDGPLGSTGEYGTQGRPGDRTLGAAAAFSGERRLGAAAAFNRESQAEGTNGAPLRLVESDETRGGRARRSAEPISAPPVGDEPDGDLLIFAQARSAWFTGHLETEESAPDWTNSADQGWQAAQRAAEPVRGEETDVGLPRRVPQANLVPGSPLPLPATSDRGLHIVRDPAAMAAHTTGYFRGSRRGEEVRGFAVGGRPGREAAGGWDFSRDGWEAEQDEDRDYKYRSASNR